MRLRLRPDYDGLDQPSQLDPGLVGARLRPALQARDRRSKTRRRSGAAALAADGVELVGVMAHLGRHSTDPAVWAGHGHELRGSDRRPLPDARPAGAPSRSTSAAATRRRATRPGTAPAPAIETIAEALTGALRSGLAAAGVDTRGVRLEAEPGRALYADAGIHLTTVRNTKRQTRPLEWAWVETDTTEMFMADLLIEHARFGVLAASQADAEAELDADVVGMSCGFDVIAPEARLPAVAPGDVLAFLDTGAYQDACASNFNGLPRPATVLVHGSEAEVVKRAETVEEVFARDVIPARLR